MIKKLIRKLKRKNRNIMLSKFAENIYFASWHTNCQLFVHPLVYEIIRFRHSEMPPTLKTDSFLGLKAGNEFSEIIVCHPQYEGGKR